MSDAADSLRRSFLTAGLSESELAWLAGQTQRRAYAAGDVIFKQGDPGNALFIVEDGEVRISVLSATGQALTLVTVYSSDPFGELSLLDGERRSATATAVRATNVYVLRRDDFMQLIHREGTALDAVLHSLADMVRAMNDKIADLQLSPAGQVAKELLRLAERHGVDGESGGTMIKHPLTYTDIASMTILESQEVERIMANYQFERVIERGPEYWTLLQPDVLRDASVSPRYRGD